MQEGQDTIGEGSENDKNTDTSTSTDTTSNANKPNKASASHSIDKAMEEASNISYSEDFILEFRKKYDNDDIIKNNEALHKLYKRSLKELDSMKDKTKDDIFDNIGTEKLKIIEENKKIISKIDAGMKGIQNSPDYSDNIKQIENLRKDPKYAKLWDDYYNRGEVEYAYDIFKALIKTTGNFNIRPTSNTEAHFDNKRVDNKNNGNIITMKDILKRKSF